MLDPAIRALAFAGQPPLANGLIRQRPQDFRVSEIPLLEPCGEGEHVWLHVRKRSENTTQVASILATHAGVQARAVSYAGLKDRHAETEQWFSVHLPGQSEPEWSLLNSEAVTVISHARHARKLQRGALKGNTFVITVRDLHGDKDWLEQRLQQVRAAGVPNYFGEQRFGRGGSNLRTAERLFANPRIRLSRNQRSMALSAARSLIFNQVLSRRISAGCWDSALTGDAMQLHGSHSYFVAEQVDEALQLRLSTHDIHPTGPLCGSGETPVIGDCLALESDVLAAHESTVQGLVVARVRQDRRALRVIVPELEWEWPAGDVLVLSFSLPPGSYATSVLRELIDAGK